MSGPCVRMPPLTLLGLSYGPEVEAMRGRNGRVLATVSGAIYLESEQGHVVGIVGPGADDGPLSLRVTELGPLKNAPQGTLFRWAGDRLEVGEAASIALVEARGWEPVQPAHMGPVSKRHEAARVLAGLLPGSAGATTRALPAQLGKVREGLSEGSKTEAAQALTGMLGLGPGLTPAGDDVAAGIVAALVWRARLGDIAAQTVECLTQAVSRVAPSRTNKISARLLAHACEGTLYAPAMQLGAALVEGNPGAIVAPAARLLSIGATTGADLAAGLLFGTLV